MSLPIEDYALVDDDETAALVGRDGSVDWLCWPRFDDDAYLSALLGTRENGRWLIAPDAGYARQHSRGRLVQRQPTPHQVQQSCRSLSILLRP